MLEILKQKNKLPVYAVTDDAFAMYGRVVTDLDVEDIIRAGEAMPMPASGASYEPSTAAFEALPIAADITKRYFGELPTQIGCCWGHSNYLNALEWHTSSEINVAITDIIIIVALRQQLDANDRIDSSKCVAFYAPKGTAFETYATTLHYCPCEASADGFRMVVALPKGTNRPLDTPKQHPTDCDKNKWLIAHVDNRELVEGGSYPGVTGENFRIAY